MYRSASFCLALQNIIARLVAWKNPAVQLVPWGILPCIVVVKLLGVLILHATSRIARPPGDGRLIQLLGVTLRSSYHIHI